ncbi:MAG: outer membrane beta-barrel protein [Alcanivoracaceae bacterium]|nr:outer membrane beta-barrel protein [Alcanivoracaceae bacterium]
MKKTILLAGGLLAISAQSALAADWDGLYAGASVANYRYTGSFFDQSYYDNGGTFDEHDIGTAYGLQVGFNKTSDSFLYGAELAYTQYDSELSSFIDSFVLFNHTLDAATSLKLRAGITEGNSLFYVFGGIADMDESHELLEPGDPTGYNTGEFDTERPMTLVGVGVEHMATEALSIRAEITQGSGQETTGNTIQDPEADWEATGDIRQFALGLNFHF